MVPDWLLVLAFLLGVFAGAVCYWLTVRPKNRRRKTRS
jgi:hypothetical protein